MSNQHNNSLFQIIITVFCVVVLICSSTLCVSAEENNVVFPEENKIYAMYVISPGGNKLYFRFYPTRELKDGYLETMSGPYYHINQGFVFTKAENGNYRITPACMPDGCIQSNGKTVNQEIAVGFFENKAEQYWTLTAQKDGFLITCADGSGGVMDYDSKNLTPILEFEGTGDIVYLEEVEITLPSENIYVKAPEQWIPSIFSYQSTAVWEGISIMETDRNGWHSLSNPGVNEFRVVNYRKTSMGAQSMSHDECFTVTQGNSNESLWIVITDDPNVEGDLTYKVYDYNPDGEPPKTADPVMLAVPALGLLTSTIALSYLLRRRKTA